MKTLLSLFLLLAVGASAATGIKISEYPNTPVLTNSELFIVAVTNTTPATNRNITYGQLRSLLASNNFVGSFTGDGRNVSNVVAAYVYGTISNNVSGVLTQPSIQSNLLLPNVSWIDSTFLTNTRTKLRKLDGGSNIQVNICFIGDSWTKQDYIVGQVRTALRARYPNAGTGFIPADLTGAPGSPMFKVPDEVIYTNQGTWSFIHPASGPSASTAHTTDDAFPGILDVYGTFTNAGVYYLQQTNSGWFRVHVGFEAWQAVGCSNATTVPSRYNYTTLEPATPHLLEIQTQGAGTSAGVDILGFDFNLSEVGVKVHNLGWSGSTVSDWLGATSNEWSQALALLNPDLVVIMFGVNEQYQNISPSIFRTNLQLLIGRVRAASATTDIMLVSPGDNADALVYSYPQADYDMIAEQIAREQRLAFFSGYRLLGDFYSANQRGYYANVNHLSSLGGKVFGNAILDKLFSGWTLPDAIVPAVALTNNDTRAIVLSNSVSVYADLGSANIKLVDKSGFGGSLQFGTSLNDLEADYGWNSVSDYSAYMFWRTRVGVTMGERMRLSTNGFLGIGLAYPTEMLSVNGNISASGAVIATNAFVMPPVSAGPVWCTNGLAAMWNSNNNGQATIYLRTSAVGATTYADKLVAP